MFKIKRILNSGSNVPEPIRLPVTASTNYKIGSALALSSGALINCTATTAPKYIAAQNFKAGSGSSMLVYPITSEMILETTVSAAPTSLAIGNKVTLDVDSDSAAIGVTATTTSGVVTVFNLCGNAAAGGKIEVTF